MWLLLKAWLAQRAIRWLMLKGLGSLLVLLPVGAFLSSVGWPVLLVLAVLAEELGFIGVAGILNVGLATVGERVEEFALRRAVGTPRALLAGIVLAETLITGLLTAALAIGVSALTDVRPGHQIVKIVYDELTAMLGERREGLKISTVPPTIVMMVGLQGSGKTTTAAKLARKLKAEGKSTRLVAADVYRPAAIDQLEILAKQEELGFYADRARRVRMALIGASGDPAKAWGPIFGAIDGLSLMWQHQASAKVLLYVRPGTPGVPALIGAAGEHLLRSVAMPPLEEPAPSPASAPVAGQGSPLVWGF